MDTTQRTDKSSMHIGIPVDHRAYMRGAHDMLKEAAKMFRLHHDEGHAAMCEAHALRLNLAIRALERGEIL